LTDPIHEALAQGRRQRAEGQLDGAQRAYGLAADLARSSGNEILLAHALRHQSDLAREAGERQSAWEYASEAVALYRRSSDTLGLANAIRLQALCTVDRQDALARWQEARDLYSSVGVAAGVRECDSHLTG
jgi:tetratricopeptide (TPR) repeat protein